MGSCLVTDARLRMTLAIIRSLGRAGIKVTAAEENLPARKPALGFYSLFTARRAWLPPLAEDPAAYLAELLRLAEEHDVLLPVSGAAVQLLVPHLTRVHQITRTALPSLSSLQRAHDKRECLNLAASLGIPVPRCYSPAAAGIPPEAGELELWARGLPFPVIVKYRRGEDLGLPAARRYRLCRNPREFAAAYLAMHALQPEPMVQEYLEGEDYGAALLVNQDCQPVASFTYRSLRQWPREGPTVFAQSVWVPELARRTLLLLQSLGWFGIAMADFRRDSRGEFRLLEINPRFWGSLALAIAAGVDFPLLYWRLAAGEPLPPTPRQREGVRMRFFPQDLLAAREYCLRARHPARYAVGWLGQMADPRVVDGVWQWRDPGPGLAYVLHLLRARHGGAT